MSGEGADIEGIVDEEGREEIKEVVVDGVGWMTSDSISKEEKWSCVEDGDGSSWKPNESSSNFASQERIISFLLGSQKQNPLQCVAYLVKIIGLDFASSVFLF